MFGVVFFFIIMIAMLISKIRLDANDHYLYKKYKDDPRIRHLGVVPSRDGWVDKNNFHPVMLYHNENGHQIKKDLKTGVETDCSTTVMKDKDILRLIAAVAKAKDDPNTRYVYFTRWNKRYTGKEGVYGSVYVDKDEPEKKYVQRYFSLNLNGNNRGYEYFPNMGREGTIKNDSLKIGCLLDIDSGKIISTTENTWYYLNFLKNREDYDTIVQMIDNFIDMFNEAQEKDGFIETYEKNIWLSRTYSKNEKYFCSTENHIGSERSVLR